MQRNYGAIGYTRRWIYRRDAPHFHTMVFYWMIEGKFLAGTDSPCIDASVCVVGDWIRQ